MHVSSALDLNDRPTWGGIVCNVWWWWFETYGGTDGLI